LAGGGVLSVVFAVSRPQRLVIAMIVWPHDVASLHVTEVKRSSITFVTSLLAANEINGAVQYKVSILCTYSFTVFFSLQTIRLQTQLTRLLQLMYPSCPFCAA
jgi:hypothetical protein